MIEARAEAVKEQNCIGTWNVRSMDQGKLEVVKQELKWTGMGEFDSDNHYIYYCGHYIYYYLEKMK